MPADGGAPIETRPIARVLIDPDADQPRRASAEQVFDVSDILGPIREQGILIPLLVEAVGERFRLIEGERRWMVAGILGIDVLPCVVRDTLAAEDRIAIQLASYARADLPPLQEARAFKRLLDALNTPGAGVATPADVADRLGRPVALVRKRLALLALVPAGQELLAASRITLGLALEIAGLAEDGQARAVQSIAALPPGPEPIGLGVGGSFVRAQRLSLLSAPWTLDDPDLHGGACSSCPKRTGAQAGLFGESVEKDECTDRRCFEAKTAEWREKIAEEDAARTVGPEKAKKGREAKADQFKPTPQRTPEVTTPAPTPKGGEPARAKANDDARCTEIRRTMLRMVTTIEERGLDTPTLAALIVRVVSPAALWHVADRRTLGTIAPKAAILESIGLFDADGEIDSINELIGELLAAHDADEPAEDGAYALTLRWLGPEKPAERVTGKSRAKPDPQAIDCPVAGCAGKAGKPCTNYKDKPCAPHAKRVDAAGAKATASFKEEVQPRAQQTTIPGSETCPLTEAHVAALAAEVEIEPHPGACSPANVWGCVGKVLDLVAQKHDVPRKDLLSALASYGDDAIDLAALYLVKAGSILRKSGGKGKGWIFSRVLPPPKAPPTASTVRTCRVCGCTDETACPDNFSKDEARCVWAELDLCSVCARCCAAALKLCAASRETSLLMKALTTSSTRKGHESFAPGRARAAVADLEKRGALGRAGDGKLLASQAT